MIRRVEGVAAVLHTPMAGRGVRFGEPSLSPLAAGAEVRFRRSRVGEVVAVWQDGDRVLWRGDLDEPDVYALVDARRLIGMPSIVQARSETQHGGMVIHDWTVAGIDLMTTAVAPWPGMEISLISR